MEGFKEFIKSPESAEIRHHAVIGGAIAFVLSAFDYFEHHAVSWKQVIFTWKFWSIPLALFVVVFIVAFLGIAFLEYFLHRPLYLKDAGKIDGDWLCALRDITTGIYNRGSIICIKSSGLGFRIEGWSYSDKELEELKQNSNVSLLGGQFTGDGSERSQDSIHFTYRGREGSRSDDGVGYYKFSKQNDHSLRLDGAFTGFTLGPNGTTITREMVGRRVTEAEKKQFKEKRYELLSDFVKTRPSEPLDLANIGVIDGIWMEAIYERDLLSWKLIEGSIVSIDSLSKAGIFELKGESHSWDKNGSKLEHIGKFHGTGHIYAERPVGIYFGFSGFEGKGELGCGYYSFVDSIDGLTFDGAFLRTIGAAPRIVFGKKVTNSKNPLDDLKTYLAACENKPPSGLPSH